MKSDFTGRLEKAAASLDLPPDLRPSLGIILGSGLGGFAEQREGPEIPYRSISGFPSPTVAGHKGALKVSGGAIILAGRFHFYEGHSLDDVVLPIFLLHRLGVRTLIVTNSAGGINLEYRPGDLVLIRDHINLLGDNPLRGPNPIDLGPRFPDLSEAYAPRLRETARSVSGLPLAEGVYAALLGPSYETPAEIRMLRGLGADLVGMSTVPEVIAARYLGMEVLGISCVTNMAAGILPEPLSHQEVIEVGRRAQPRLERILGGLLEALPPCP